MNKKEMIKSTAALQGDGCLEPGPFYHGTKADLKPGELLEPGFSSNYGERKKANFIYFTATMDAAIWGDFDGMFGSGAAAKNEILSHWAHANQNDG